jgi:hypothetical protein
VLISDLKSYLSGLTADIDGGFFPDEGEVEDYLRFYFEFDSSIGGDLPHSVSTDPSTLQVTYNDISSDKNLVGKLAGNDSATDHKDWTTEFVGWPTANSPEAAIREWFAAVDQMAYDRSLGNIPTDPSGSPITKTFVTADGVDYQQLIDKLLRVGIGYSQTTDDYLDDDPATEGKGLLADHSELKEEKNYTALEHAWDEGYGYFGAARNYGAWSTADRMDTTVDDNEDGVIDLLTEKTWHCANNAGKRDDASITGTTLGDDAYNAFYDGREILANADGALSDSDYAALVTERNKAVGAMEAILAATVIHYINDTIDDQDAIGTSDYSFNDHAKHWSEAKGFALGFQFSPHSRLSDADFAALHNALGVAPALEGDDLAAYKSGLIVVRDDLGAAMGFDAADVADW